MLLVMMHVMTTMIAMPIMTMVVLLNAWLYNDITCDCCNMRAQLYVSLARASTTCELTIQKPTNVSGRKPIGHDLRTRCDGRSYSLQ